MSTMQKSNAPETSLRPHNVLSIGGLGRQGGEKIRDTFDMDRKLRGGGGKLEGGK